MEGEVRMKERWLMRKGPKVRNGQRNTNSREPI